MPFSSAFVASLLKAQAAWDDRSYHEPKTLLIKGDAVQSAAIAQQLQQLQDFDVDLIQAIGLHRDTSGNALFHESFLNKLQRCAIPGSLQIQQSEDGLELHAAYLELLAGLALLLLQDGPWNPLIDELLLNL